MPEPSRTHHSLTRHPSGPPSSLQIQAILAQIILTPSNVLQLSFTVVLNGGPDMRGAMELPEPSPNPRRLVRAVQVDIGLTSG